jgi:hypothetical protein
VLPEALTRHIGLQVGTLMTSGPFALSSAEELRTLIAGANFSDIAIRPAAKIVRYPSPDEFVLRYAAGSALAGPVTSADDNARAALLAEVNAKLQSYVDEQGLAFPIESNLARVLFVLVMLTHALSSVPQKDQRDG